MADKTLDSVPDDDPANFGICGDCPECGSLSPWRCGCTPSANTRRPLDPLRALLANASNVLQELTLPAPEYRELDAAIDAAIGVIVRLETIAEQERGNA